MAQKVIKVGDSVAVVIPKKSLPGLGIRAGSKIDVEINQQAKIITVRLAGKSSVRQERIAELTFNFINRYRKDLEALARK
ncbi:MAG: hypothetical protein HYX23_01820 [Candidatus Zambryskibacteria bacterium]|nr:hypothetical protein [Candidatus Zambryskibacteria bacterium]